MACRPEAFLDNAASQFGGVEADAPRVVDHQRNAVRRVRTDIGPASMSAFHQAFAFQQLQRTADRDPGESELLTQGVLGGQLLARPKFAALNQVTNPRCDPAVAGFLKAHGGTESPLAGKKSSFAVIETAPALISSLQC